jgi:hypothetical protein
LAIKHMILTRGALATLGTLLLQIVYFMRTIKYYKPINANCPF